MQLTQRFRKAVPQAKQYFDRKSVHIWSGVVPGVQHLGQNFNVVDEQGIMYLNEKTGHPCTIIEHTTANAPYCLVKYADGVRKTEHFADLKRIREVAK